LAQQNMRKKNKAPLPSAEKEHDKTQARIFMRTGKTRHADFSESSLAASPALSLYLSKRMPAATEKV